MILAYYVHEFLTALFFTVCVETTVLFLCVRLVLKHPAVSSYRLALIGFFANALTIPYVWFVFPFLLEWSRGASLLYSEPFAFIVEAVFYRFFLGTNWGESSAISLLANCISYFGALMLMSHGIWLS